MALRRRPSTGAHVALTTEARERYSPRLSRSPLAGRVAGAEVLTLEVSGSNISSGVSSSVRDMSSTVHVVPFGSARPEFNLFDAPSCSRDCCSRTTTRYLRASHLALRRGTTTMRGCSFPCRRWVRANDYSFKDHHMLSRKCVMSQFVVWRGWRRSGRGTTLPCLRASCSTRPRRRRGASRRGSRHPAHRIC